ncbi:sialidase family protein [Roseicitreum antarcticum]|uniref:BNR repeat-like domain-containing protein n=1 Tax=Roseicitreum antarcticum TaxID=564137 RepID=A0A1H3AVY7_9RHOB|nr:sialidase family protein [Roseicitreum antarcticum]SDX33765.1 BNR repeat-like domain-containing protein [Roseicitreum antarcticum]
MSRTHLSPLLAPVLAGMLFAAAAAPAPAQEFPPGIPFEMAGDVLDFSDTDTLGLTMAEGTETFTIFAPEEGGQQFAHGVVLMPFKGQLYAQWQSSARDEDGPDTVVVHAVSDNGSDWSAPAPLTTEWDGGYKSSGGWWTDGETLVAYLNVWPADLSPRGGHVEYVATTDGVNWSEPAPVTMADGSVLNGIFEQDPRALAGDAPDGARIVSFAHFQPGLIATPIYTDDPMGVSGWTKGAMTNLPTGNPDISRELEPSAYMRGDGALVAVFRDQGNSFYKLASVSEDAGETWSDPVLTNMPDARTKQSAGNLPDGTAYLVGNPHPNKARMPLAVVLSDDGYRFDRAFLLRAASDMQPMRFEGQYKRPSYSYPKSVVWNGHLYAAYATNKEDAELTRVPLESLTAQ